MPTPLSWRGVLRRLHLALGLAVGAVYALTALSGALLAFYLEIDRVVAPPPPVPPVTAPTVSWQAVAEVLRREFPQRDGVWRIELPDTADTVVTVRYPFPEEKAAGRFAPLLVDLDPQAPRVLRARFWGDTAMTVLYDLHYSLCLGQSGRTAQAVLAGLAVLSTLSGLWLWWPTVRHHPGKAMPRLRAGGIRPLYDLHVLVGVYGQPILLPLTVTGMLLALPPTLSPMPTMAAPAAIAMAPPRISADQALAIARHHLPQAEARWLELPPRQGGLYRVRMRQAADGDPRFPRSSVWIDAADGRVVALVDAERLSWAERLWGWLRPLHNGVAFGLGGRVAVAVAGLLAVALPVSGVLFWWRRRHRRQSAG